MLASQRLMGFAPTTDLDAAVPFYRDVLQLDFQFQDQFAAVFHCGGSTLRVVLVQSFEPAPFTVVGWAVDDVRATARWLVERGVELLRFPGMAQDELGIWTPPGAHAGVAWFRDPAGNTLSISSG